MTRLLEEGNRARPGPGPLNPCQALIYYLIFLKKVTYHSRVLPWLEIIRPNNSA